MIRLTESNIKRIVRESLNLIKENYDLEYRTKGSLNKKTIERNNAQQPKMSQQASLDYHPEWDETADDILDKYNTGNTYDDTKIGEKYQIDASNPFYYTKEGKQEDADSISNFHNNFAIVKKNGLSNFITENGVLLCDDWFDFCNDFENGFAVVGKDRKRNYVNQNGDYLLTTWVDRAGDFEGDTAPVIINGERHLVDADGNLH